MRPTRLVVCVAIGGSLWAQEEARAASLYGRVLKADGSPWEGACVVGVCLTSEEEIVAEAHSDSRGDYRLPGLAEGKYVVVALELPRGRVGARGALADIVVAGFRSLIVELLRERAVDQGIVVSKGAAVKCDITAPHAARLVGTVKCGDRPAAGVAVKLRRVAPTVLHGAFLPKTVTSVTTDRGGRFVHEGIAVGRYSVRCRVDDADVRCDDVEVAAAQVEHVVRLGEYNIVAEVKEATGEPATDLSIVRAFYLDRPGVHVTRRGCREPNGIYKIPFVEAGVVEVEVEKGGVRTSAKVVVGPGGKTARLELRLPTLADVWVTVEGGTGDRRQGVLVRVVGAEELLLQSDANGEIRIRVPAGAWRIGIVDERAPFEWMREPVGVEVAGGTVTKVPLKVLD